MAIAKYCSSLAKRSPVVARLAVLRRMDDPNPGVNHTGVNGPMRILTVVLLWFSAAMPLAAQPAEEALTTVRARIERLTARINEAQSSRERVLGELRRNELQAGLLVKQLHTIERRLAASGGELERLVEEQQRQLSMLDKYRRALARRIRASYAVARQDYVKLLLNQENPAALGRTVAYHGYFQRARTRQILDLESRLADLATLKSTIELKRAALLQLKDDKSGARSELDDIKQRRVSLVANLAREIDNNAAHLERLKADEEKLQALLSDLRALNDIPEGSAGNERFASLRGELPWPSHGLIVRRFDSAMPTGAAKWRGVLIAADEGEPVRAVSRGRVAFADWLRGFGLLLIIDHGDGYMSLYGRNQTLFKEVGDWVDGGEIIALVGNSGGSERSGLYFEIRHDGIPTDPVRWCRAGGAGA